jgi:preprotein translocase subunit SecB
VAIYSKPEGSSVNWSEFSDGLAVAHMVPFVREFIASTTDRMPLTPLVFRPVNAFVLVENYQKRQAEKAVEAEPVAP